MKKDKYRIIILAAIVVLVFSALAGCSTSTPAAPAPAAPAPAAPAPAAPAPAAPAPAAPAPAAPERTWPDPSMEFTIVCPYNPGGGADAINRFCATYIEKYLGIPVVVQNVPGSAGLVGTNTVFAGKSDGYTCIYAGTEAGIFAFKHFAPAAIPWETNQWKGTGIFANVQQMGMICHKDSPWQDFGDLIEDARSKPPKSITLANIGPGRFDDVWVIELQQVFGVEFNWVFYEGSGPILTDLLTGDLDVGLVQVTRADFIDHPDYRVLIGFESEYPDGMPYKGIYKTPIDFQQRLGYTLADVPALTIPSVVTFYVKADIPQEAHEAICEAVEMMYNDPEWQEGFKAFNWPGFIPYEEQVLINERCNAIMGSYAELHRQFVPR